jgi:hypothetical protein
MQIGHSFIYTQNPSTEHLLEAVTYIQYDNYLKDGVVLQGGDVSALYDGLTNIFYEVSTFPRVIEIDLNVAREVNCVSIAGCNFKTANANFYIETYDAGVYTARGYISNLDDNQPAMLCFESVIADRLRVTINATGTLFIGELAMAKALKMPVSPSVGYTPAKWNVADEITHHVTSSLNVGRSTINLKGAVEILPFKMINHDWMRNTWSAFIKAAKGRAVWVGWNQLDYQSECVYGSWKQDTSAYDRPLYSSLTLTITGVV